YIGVSNYARRHLNELLSYARIPPAVNQIEYHPYQVDNITKVCRQHGIAVQAYGSIQAKGLLEDAEVKAVAAAVGRQPAQVLLRWAVQLDVMIITKSANEQRILDNAKLWDFTLSSEQQGRLSSLHQGLRTWGEPNDHPAVDSENLAVLGSASSGLPPAVSAAGLLLVAGLAYCCGARKRAVKVEGKKQ
ncbi:unnamed protein product, partial [Polarella glacialis]